MYWTKTIVQYQYLGFFFKQYANLDIQFSVKYYYDGGIKKNKYTHYLKSFNNLSLLSISPYFYFRSKVIFMNIKYQYYGCKLETSKDLYSLKPAKLLILKGTLSKYLSRTEG